MTLLEDDLKIKDYPQLKLISIKSWIEHPMINQLCRLAQLSLSLAQLIPSLILLLSNLREAVKLTSQYYLVIFPWAYYCGLGSWSLLFETYKTVTKMVEIDPKNVMQILISTFEKPG